tara:strand:- start:36662 stop:37534 length:873 start_codon:yes stop_codon:yes gene_type:complete
MRKDIKNNPYLMVLGITQDTGYPQINCSENCCKLAWDKPELKKMTTSLGIVDPISNQQWILDATPNITEQLHLLSKSSEIKNIEGIFITHAHIGHYTGLMYFGKEGMNTSKTPVFVMPKMKKFLEENAPWSQLVNSKNISLNLMKDQSFIQLNKRIKITPFLVPHRDDYSETVGFKIQTKSKRSVFIPDIDKWGIWDKDIISIVKESDYAFLDATFYKNGELNRDMSEIPHPFVEESMEIFSELSAKDKSKVYFIHLNHTNPLLIENSPSYKKVLNNGFNVAREGQIIKF